MNSALLIMKLISVAILVAACVLQGRAASLSGDDGTATKSLRVDVEIEGEHFVFGLNEYVTWSASKQICEDMGMRLLTMETEERWLKLKNFIYGNSVYDYWWWTSGRKPLNSVEFTWSTTGTPLTYDVWYPNQPSNTGLNDDSCMQMNAGNEFSPSGWDDVRCVDALTPYICEMIP